MSDKSALISIHYTLPLCLLFSPPVLCSPLRSSHLVFSRNDGSEKWFHPQNESLKRSCQNQSDTER